VLYLYALSEPPTSAPEVPGLDEAPVAVERVGEIDAVVSALDRARIEPSEQAILDHARVVERLAEANAAVLPARFGRGFADAAALGSAVGDRAADLKRALDLVRGCSELALRVLAPAEGAQAAVASGRDYMRARLDERQRTERLANELHRPLSALARAATRSVGSGSDLVFSAAYLVPREVLDEFGACVAELGADHPELTLACTGPWPPYSFATAEPGAG
jgi:Gas vesicle synthesis protein GvpL/GvpF